jgi:hypothetical protein
MPFFEALSLSSIGKIATTIWANGSRFLWSVAVACALVAGVLRAAAYFQIHDAQLWWDTYGLTLMIAAVAVGVFAVFKLWAEWQNTKVFMIANERESLWHHAKQQDGSIVTQFAFRFHATNTNKTRDLLDKGARTAVFGRSQASAQFALSHAEYCRRQLQCRIPHTSTEPPGLHGRCNGHRRRGR